jgi:hypothetical protein
LQTLKYTILDAPPCLAHGRGVGLTREGTSRAMITTVVVVIVIVVIPIVLEEDRSTCGRCVT